MQNVLSRRERQTVNEVFSQYSGLDLDAAMLELQQQAWDTEPCYFNAYTAAHNIAAAMTKEPTP